MKQIFLTLTLWFPLSLYAYVPDLNMIIDRTEKNNGHGMYRIHQEVIFPSQPKPLVVNEIWVLNDNGSMRLKAQGMGRLRDQLNVIIVYNSGVKYYVNSKGVKKTLRQQPEFLERFFHFQDQKKFKSLLAGLKIIPAKAVYASNRIYSLNNHQAKPNPYVELSRANGSVNYLLTQNKEDINSPKMWIEQDQFNISKIKFAKDRVLSAKHYETFSRGLTLPKKRKLLWNNQVITINLLKVVPLASTQANKSILHHSSLKPQDESNSLKLSNLPLVDEFYKTFR